MKKYILSSAVSLIVTLLAANSSADLQPRAKKLRLPNFSQESYSFYNQRVDLGTHEMVLRANHVNVRDLFADLKKNSQVAAELYTWDQESLEELYANLSSGPFPKSSGNGQIIFDGKALLDAEGIINRIGAILPIPGGLSELGKPALRQLVGFLWHGKKFIPQAGKLTHVLVNRIENVGPLTAFLRDGDDLETKGANFTGIGGETYMMPAKVYCGESLLDTRKESIIIDYAYSEDVVANGHRIEPGARIPLHRALVNRTGLNIRDEIRMVRPGLYLGRAYIQNMFVLHFVLSNDTDFNAEVADDCRNPLSDDFKANKAKISSL